MGVNLLHAALFMSFMALPVLSMASTVSLPQTGQTTCYDENGNLNYSVSENTNTSSRADTITIADQTFTVTKESIIDTSLSINIAAQRILFGDTPEVTGELTAPLSVEASDLSGLTITLHITDPSGVETIIETVTYHSLGNYIFENLSNFTTEGTYTIWTSFEGTDTLNDSESDHEPLLVGLSPGYAIIIQGKISSEEGLEYHARTTDMIYQQHIERRFNPDEDIQYFNYTTSKDGIHLAPDKSTIQYAIESWAFAKMVSSPAPLYIIMVGHGDQDTFYINSETISPTEIDSWLDTLEDNLSTYDISETRLVIYSACYSGSFIQDISKDGRIIITSADETEFSYRGPAEPPDNSRGPFFIEEFFKMLGYGHSIKDSFIEATEVTELFTRNEALFSESFNRYFDNAVEHPMLDDNGDGVGTNAVTDGSDDGKESAGVFLGSGESYTDSNPNIAEIVNVTETLYLDSSASSTLLWNTTDNDSDVENIWMYVRPPIMSLNSGEGTEDVDIGFTISERVLFSYNESDSRWEANFESFDESGIYEVFYFIRDIYNPTRATSPIRRSLVYKNKSGNNPPGVFSLDSPVYGSEQSTLLIFKWDASTDPDGDNVTYNLLIATDSSFSNVVYRKEEINSMATIVDAGAGLSDLTAYYWKVQAVDAYGLVSDSAQTWPFYTNNTNSTPGFIFGVVYDETTFAAIEGATISTDLGSDAVSIEGGYYFLENSSGTYTVTCSYSDYSNNPVSGIRVNSGEITELNIPMSDLTSETNPKPDIKANGSDNTITIGTSDTLSITVSLSAGNNSGTSYDWWVAGSTPTGWYYFDVITMSWLYAGESPAELSTTYQGALFDLPSYSILNTSGLSTGTYTYYFAIDTDMNGILDLDKIYFDIIVVTVE